ncbi:ATP-binding protein [Polymorphospora rubra]|uniref:ATP-binding protein n=1 Tax=Polymorphospora rubra TaxID=338584 RepID=UPI001BB43FAC|nr:tetratricopeptide repeat protein [Polymorphospora rubra]
MAHAQDHDAGFGRLLQRVRRAARLTQEELAERSGVAVRTISDIERGKVRTAQRETARRLVTALRLTGPDQTAFEEAARGRPPTDAGGAGAPAPSGPAGTTSEGADTAPGAVAASPPVTFRQVHPPPTPLIGRENESRAVVGTLSRPDVRIVTLTGTGGVGKTRVALAVAEAVGADFADGVCDVDLTLVSGSADVVTHLIGAAGGEIRRGDVAELADVLGQRRLLLLLDNFEHVLPAAPAVAAVLARCPNLKLLVTSRVALHIRGEHEYRLDPLPVPDADPPSDAALLARSASVRLFAWHASARRSDWRLTDANAATVARICRLLDGVPLAIELAAVRVGLFPVDVIAQRLDRRLGRIQLLTAGPRDAPDRQRTLAAAIGWSVGLLPPPAQRLLARLSVFPARYTVEAAELVCAGDDGRPAVDVLEGLAVIGDHHLHRSLADGRFAMYEAVREFAAERLRELGEEEAIAARHTGYVVAEAEQAAIGLAGAEQEHWLERMEGLRYDLPVVLARVRSAGDPETAVQIAGAVWRFWYGRGAIADGRRWLDEALAAGDPDPTDPTPARHRARALNAAAALGHYVGLDHAEVAARYRAATVLWRRAGDDVGLAGTLSNLAMSQQYANDPEAARRTYDEALVAARRAGDERVVATALLNLGILLVQQGEPDPAGPALDESLRLFQRAGNVRATADVYTAQALLATATCRYARAERLAERSRELFLRLQDELGDTESLLVIAQAVELSGTDDARARKLYETGLETCRRLGDVWGPGLALVGLGRLALRRADRAAAAELADAALAHYRSLGFQTGVRIAAALRAAVESTDDPVPSTDLYALLPP